MSLALTVATSKSSILVVDDSDLCRELTSDCLRAQGFDTLEAGGAQAAFRQLEGNRADLIILDNEMPGMSGLEFLKALRANARLRHLPVIMLTSSSSKSIVVEALRLGVRGYMIKSRYTMPEMVNRIRAALAGEEPPAPHSAVRPAQTASVVARPAPVAALPIAEAHAVRPQTPAPKLPAKPATFVAPNLVSRAAVLKAIDDVASTKTLAGVVAGVIALANSGHSSLSDITGVLKRDPVLSARVVQLACSSAYAGSRSKLASIDDAVRIIGATAIRELALTVGIFDSFPAGRADGLDLLRCWQHAFSVAAAMERIVPRSDALPAGTAHLVGLCHDLGEILLRQQFPKEYAAAADFARGVNGPVSGQISSVFGITMIEVVETLLATMKLPTNICDPIVEFSRRPRGTADAHAGLLARSLAIANFYAHALALTASMEEAIAPVMSVDCRSSLLPTAQIDWQSLRSEATGAIAALSKLKPDEEAAMLRMQITKREDCQVGYLRHHAFADLDPLEVAIDSVCNGVLLQRSVRGEDLKPLQGLIVVSPAVDASLASEACRLRALAGIDLPILHITAPREHPSMIEAPGFEETEYPITLKRLSRFVSTLK